MLIKKNIFYKMNLEKRIKILLLIADFAFLRDYKSPFDKKNLKI